MSFKPHTTRRVALAAMAALSLASTAAFAEVKAKIGHAMPESHPQAAAMNKFAELVGTYTKGNVKMQAYHSAVLGSDEKQLQAVQAGTQEFYIGTLAPLSTRVKEVQVWDLPFMFANEKEVYAGLDGASSKKIFEKIEPAGLVGLTWTGMGFRNLSNSRMLEPAAGSGNFVSAMPPALRAKAQITAVELEPLSARILGQLHPDITLHAGCGFQDVNLPENAFDLAISNVPFGDFGVADVTMPERFLTARIHDYFFAKALRLVRPLAPVGVAPASAGR